MATRRSDLERFYDLLGALTTMPGQGRPLAEYSGSSGLPRRGVYFFQEPGEYRIGQPAVRRIVRVGTHAVSANSRSTLWGRLRAHRGTGKGGGNHRGSIFRLHVGAALLRRDQLQLGELPTWGVGSSAPKEVRATETTHEERVSVYLGNMPVLWVEVPDDPGPESERAYIERNAIGLLSNQLTPIDSPSSGWLGQFSPREEIRRCGLWNLNHVYYRHEGHFLAVLEDAISMMQQRASPGA